MTLTNRTTQVLFALSGHSLNGLRLQQLCDALGDSPSTVLRTLRRLADDGLVEPVPELDKHWRLSARVVQIAIAHQAELAREHQRLNDFEQRYGRKPSL